MILTKVIANSPSLTYDSESEQVADDEASSKEKEIDKLVALISMSFKKIYKPTNNILRTSSNTRNMNVDNTSRSDKKTGYSGSAVDWDSVLQLKEFLHVITMENIQEVMPDAADNSGPIFNVEPLQKVHTNNDNYNVFANEIQHPEQPESINDTYVLEKDDNNTSPDSSNMCSEEGEADQDDDLEKESDFLASLIAQLKCKIDDNKNQNKI
ncbi:hypothetical protein Tco_0389160 [Tanacetum coccineum]